MESFKEALKEAVDIFVDIFVNGMANPGPAAVKGEWKDEEGAERGG